MSSPLEENLPPHEVPRVATLMLQFMALFQKQTQLGTITELEISAGGPTPREQLRVLQAQRQHLTTSRDLQGEMISTLDQVIAILDRYV